jgi:hypothetical protein
MTSEEVSCLRKVAHTSQQKACAALANTRRLLNIGPGEMQIYHCRFCHLWPIGHVRVHRVPMRYMRLK